MQAKPLLELSFYEPVFSVASHPSEPLMAVGLTSGYIFMIKYDYQVLRSLKNKSDWKIKLTKDGYEGDSIEIVWKTRRHKGSVRSLAFDPQGESLYSIGSDKVLKKSIVSNGKVSNKTTFDQEAPFTKILKSQTHDFLILGDEDGDITVVDSNSLKVTNKIETVHEETINDIIQQMPNKYPFRFISVGATTLSIFDIRKPKPISVSDNQEDEILSTSLISIEDNYSSVVCGMGDGIVTVWGSKNEFMDQQSRIKISKGESIDCIISSFRNDGMVWCGVSNGLIYKIDVKKGKIAETRIHSKLDEVAFLDIDYNFRVVSGGMDSIRLWDEEDENEDEDDVSDDFSDDDSDKVSDDDSDDEFKGFEEDSDMEAIEEAIQEKEALENKKLSNDKKRELEEEDEEGEKEPKLKLTNKQKRMLEKKQKNMAKHIHGINKFDDL